VTKRIGLIVNPVGHPAVQILRGGEVGLEAAGIISYADGERFASLPPEVPGHARRAQRPRRQPPNVA